MITLEERSNLPLEFGDMGVSRSSVVGDYSNYLKELIENAPFTESNSFSDREKIHELVENINNLFFDSQKGNVDNYGGKAGNIDSFRNIREFIHLIPGSLLEITPMVLLEPDGSFALDWENEQTGASFAISFGSNHELYFAGLFNNEAKQRGVEIFDRFWVPKSISKNISRVIKER